MKHHNSVHTGIAMSAKKTSVYLASTALTLLTVLGVAVAPVSAAPVLVNGSFETGTPPGLFTTLFAGDSTSIPGWTVTSGNVDYIGTYWTSADGSRSLDMNGVDPGAISQTFATVPGHSYSVTFEMAGNPDGGTFGSPAVKTMDVMASGSPATSYSFDTTGHGDASMGWVSDTYHFTAAGASTTLTFMSTVTGSQPQTWFGPALDNVAIALDAPTTKDQCKDNGWKDYVNPAFKNQGDCVSFIATNGKNQPSGL